MPTTTEFDTIAAISTPPGEGGISIIRISGDQTFNVVTQILRVKISVECNHTQSTMDILLILIPIRSRRSHSDRNARLKLIRVKT